MITHLWLVTKPTHDSTIGDILSRVSLAHDLCNQYLGGLDPNNIIGFYQSESHARDVATRALVQDK